MTIQLLHNIGESPTVASDDMLAPDPGQSQILHRLHQFVRQACHDPVFRRRLRYDPQAALTIHGFDASNVPDDLGIKHYQVDVLINPAQIFGLMAPQPVRSPRLELRLVLYGVKSAALLHGDEQDLTDCLHWCRQHGLTALLSPDQWQVVSDQGKGGYSNLTGQRRRAQAGSGAERSLVVSQNPDTAMLAWLCLVFNWEEFLGRLLGYPVCCSRAFAERWPIAAAEHQGDPTVLSLNASGPMPYDWRCNIAARYFGYQLIQHFPCSFDCQASIDLGRKYFDTLDFHEPALAQQTRHHLQAPVLYTEYQGIALLCQSGLMESGDLVKIGYHAGDSLYTEQESDFSRLVQQSAQVVFDRSSKKITIGEQIKEGVYMLVFSQR